MYPGLALGPKKYKGLPAPGTQGHADLGVDQLLLNHLLITSHRSEGKSKYFC